MKSLAHYFATKNVTNNGWNMPPTDILLFCEFAILDLTLGPNTNYQKNYGTLKGGSFLEQLSFHLL